MASATVSSSAATGRPGADAAPLKPSEFEKIRRLAYEQFGLDLKQGKEELVTARLGRLMRQGAFPSFAAYYEHVVEDRSGEALIEMIDALTTNHTSFLREPAHFEFLESVARSEFGKDRPLRMWSAACSTGEEPYSIAFCLLNAGLGPADFRILATDISTRALAKARRATYPAERFEQMPQPWRRRFLLQGEGDWKGWYKVKPEVTRAVEFRRLNLVRPFSNCAYHVIFCRNVMMYFDHPTQAELVDRMRRCLEPGGYLLVGHSESLSGIEHRLTYCRPATYRNGQLRKGGAA